uniref:Cystatin-like n=1 Tax=Sinocyclocheilus grahami TaxID=75366 RepID=A0A672PMM8_SINGR
SRPKEAKQNKNKIAYLYFLVYSFLVVAGTNYIFTVKLGRTNCKKGGVETLCAIHKDPKVARVIQCKITVWSKPWLNFLKVTENTCI